MSDHEAPRPIRKSQLVDQEESTSLETQERSINSIAEVSQDLFFRPSDSHRKLKSRFWIAFSDSPLQGAKAITPTMVARITGDHRVIKWWSMPGFKEWFTNADENRERLEFLFSLALDAAENILRNEDPKAQGARVNVIKAIAELANKLPERRVTPIYADEQIQKMDKNQLEEYLKRQGIAVDSLIGTSAPLPTFTYEETEGGEIKDSNQESSKD
jgi:uncharacterized protein (DUF924 family)